VGRGLEGAISLSVALHYSALIGIWEITAKRLCDLYLDAKLVTEETWTANFVWSPSVGGQVFELL
jgi:hypothetical protein